MGSLTGGASGCTLKQMIFKALEEAGPMTGRELLAQVRPLVAAELYDQCNLMLWRECVRSDGVLMRCASRRYLRLDRNVAGYARLSPSIIREFHNYTVIALEAQENPASVLLSSLSEKMKNISDSKYRLAEEIIGSIVASRTDFAAVNASACFIIAGDVAYGMSHDDPRPESSTGLMVKGSDLDIICVTDGLPPPISKSLEQAIYEKKYFLLKNPGYREEIDYVVKDISKVRDQLMFDDFKHMVASKILNEGLFLYGNRKIFDDIGAMLAEYDIPGKLLKLEEKAAAGRREAEALLLADYDALPHDECMKLFCTNEEREEFE